MLGSPLRWNMPIKAYLEVNDNDDELKFCTLTYRR
jgi:hypothetical protein